MLPVCLPAWQQLMKMMLQKPFVATGTGRQVGVATTAATETESDALSTSLSFLIALLQLLILLLLLLLSCQVLRSLIKNWAAKTKTTRRDETNYSLGNCKVRPEARLVLTPHTTTAAATCMWVSRVYKCVYLFKSLEKTNTSAHCTRTEILNTSYCYDFFAAFFHFFSVNVSPKLA